MKFYGIITNRLASCVFVKSSFKVFVLLSDFWFNNSMKIFEMKLIRYRSLVAETLGSKVFSFISFFFIFFRFLFFFFPFCR